MDMSSIISNEATDASLFEFKKNKKGEVSIINYFGDDRIVVIPETLDGGVVKELGKGAFKDNDTVYEVIMPDCIETVRGGSFVKCRNLKKVHLSEKLSRIVKNTFIECTALEEVNIPDNTAELKADTFVYAQLNKLHIGKSLQRIEEGAFFTEKREVLGLDADPSMFKPPKGRNTKDITIDPQNNYLRVVDSMILSADGKTLWVMLGGDKTCTIPEGVETIKRGAFSMQGQLENVVFPHSLKVIEENAFLCCRGLSSLVFNEGLEVIRNGAFFDVPVPVVNLPSSLKRLGPESFILFQYYGNINFKQDIHIDPQNPYLWSDGSAIYMKDENEVILSILYGSAFKQFYNSDFNWETGDSDNKHIYEIAEGTTGIGEAACKNRPGVILIRIPESVKIIGDEAFYYCRGLKKINLPDGLEIIGENAFRGTELTRIEIPASVKEIGSDAFYTSSTVKWESVTVDPNNQRFFTRGRDLYEKNDDGNEVLIDIYRE